MWRRIHFVLAAFTIVLAAVTGRQAAAVEQCDATGTAKVLCFAAMAEDLVPVPNSDWIIVSGSLRAINTGTLDDVILFSTAQKFDKKRYGACPGPLPDEELEKQSFAAAGGLNLRAGDNDVHTLYMMHRDGGRNSIEVFEVDFSRAAPGITWIGCVLHPPKAFFNSTAPLPDHGIVATNYCCSETGQLFGEAGKSSREQLFNGEISGAVWEWSPQADWRKLPGTEGSGPNGIEVSADGAWLYVAEWAANRILRISRGQSAGDPVTREVIAELNFHPDNLRWQTDGTLVTAGAAGSIASMFNDCFGESHDCSGLTSSVAIIDPNTSTATTVVEGVPIDAHFEMATAATLVGQEVWATSIGQKGRIARFPLP